jgi:hypothetical protein
VSFVVLIAAMTVLATPTAHGTLSVRCEPPTDAWGVPTGTLGIADPWNGGVVLAPKACRNVRRVVLHRAWAPKPDPPPLAKVHRSHPNELDPTILMDGLFVLLHEAAHVAQYRDDEETPFNELDANCRAFAGMSGALARLGYGPRIRREVRRMLRQDLRTGTGWPPEYVGECPR